MRQIHFRLIWRPNLQRYLAEATIKRRKFTQKITDVDVLHWLEDLRGNRDDIYLGELRLVAPRTYRLQLAEYIELVKECKDELA